MIFENFGNFIFIIIPKTKGVKINKLSWISESTKLRLNSLDLEVTTVSQKIIVNGEIIDAKEVKKTDNGTLPFLICDSKPETCPPGTISTITAAIANKEVLNNSEIRMPIKGSSKSWMQRP